jgi:hypothetical protein
VAALALAGCGGAPEPADAPDRPELTAPGEEDEVPVAPSEPADDAPTTTGPPPAPAPSTPPPPAEPPEPRRPASPRAPADMPQQDRPPEPGSPAERFERFCDENPEECG